LIGGISLVIGTFLFTELAPFIVPLGWFASNAWWLFPIGVGMIGFAFFPEPQKIITITVLLAVMLWVLKNYSAG